MKEEVRQLFQQYAGKQSRLDRTYGDDRLSIISEKCKIMHQIIDALEDKWIPVSEGLPEHRQPVLVWIPADTYEKVQKARFRVYMDGEKGFMAGGGSYLLSDAAVTHWQPLPEEPREED